MSVGEGVLLVLSILGSIALIFGVAMIPVRHRARRIRAELEAELGHDLARVANVRGLGLHSRGAGQVRGNGWLVLTASELRFRQWFPRRETRIPLDAITAVETPRWWLGKTVGSRLLCVRWRTADGGEDAMAWDVSDLDGWLSALGGRR